MDDFDVFVYCGGKCGSMTLHETFKQNGYKTCHTHDNRYWTTNLKNTIPIFDYIDNSSKNRKIYIIDCYRTPIERTISSFFQNIHIILPNYNELSIHEIIEWYNSNELYFSENYHPINEVLNYYKFPLFEKFDFKKRYNKIEKDNKIFVKILFSNINDWQSILSEICETPIVIYSDNLTNNKNIIDLYNEFKKHYKIPKSYLIDIINTDGEFKIYNTPEQQKEYFKKWSLNSY